MGTCDLLGTSTPPMVLRLAGAMCAVAGVAFALLWDPTTCMTPAIGCAVGAPCPPPPVSCTHQYVLLRIVTASVAVAVGVGLVVLATYRGRQAPPPSDPARVRM